MAGPDLLFVKEKVPQALCQATVDFATGSAIVRDLVPRANPCTLIFGTDTEGVTIDASGIFLVGETPLLCVLTPAPEPGTWLLLLSGTGVLAWRQRRLRAVDQANQPLSPA